MSFFSSNVELSLGDFITRMSATQGYRDYQLATGSKPMTDLLCQVIFDEACKIKDKDGYWVLRGGMPANVTPTFNTKIKCRKDDVAALISQSDGLLKYDNGLIGLRTNKADALLVQATRGALHTKLNTNAQAESDYHTPSPVTQKHGAPPVPPRTVMMDAKLKAKKWLKASGVDADTYIDEYGVGNGKWPLGPNEKTIAEIWSKLVNPPMKYRKVVMGAQYPSSIGGLSILKKMVEKMDRAALPAAGDTDWENYALFMFGTIMSVQGFPDGNKRIARVVYAILMVNAAIPFRAPGNAFGAELAGM